MLRLNTAETAPQQYLNQVAESKAASMVELAQEIAIESQAESVVAAAEQATRQLQSAQATLSSSQQDEQNRANAPQTDECCADANPLLTQDIALTVLILQIVTPGIGAIVAAYYDPKGCNCKCATFGVLQLLLVIVIAGYVWSIVQGVAIYNKSNTYYADQQSAVTASTSASTSN